MKDRGSQRTFSFAFAVLLAVLPILPAAMAAEPVTVTITDALDPSSLTIAPGTAVTWENADVDRHRLRTTSGPVDFDSGNLEPGDSFTFTFNTEGTYSYLDDRNDDNPNYYGTVIVASGGGEPPTDPPSTGTTVDIVNRLFRPANITISAGTTVTWRNVDDRPHTVTARDRSFDSGIFDTGGSWQRTFNSAGTFEYFCILHPDMVGTVTVGDGGGGEPPPPEPPPEPPPPAPPGDVTIFDNVRRRCRFRWVRRWCGRTRVRCRIR
jgi:plastocyanin